jgi:hypothetical protein
MMRAATILWAILATIAGTGLFLLKYQVQAEERHLRELRKDIASTEQSIHVLKAEWSYLNDPLRLREQAERHLAMHPMRANQMVSIDSIPMVGGPLYEPPGLLPIKAAPKAAAKPAAPPHKPLMGGGKVMTAKASKPAAKPARAPEVASSKVRP